MILHLSVLKLMPHFSAHSHSYQNSLSRSRIRILTSPALDLNLDPQHGQVRYGTVDNYTVLSFKGFGFTLLHQQHQLKTNPRGSVADLNPGCSAFLDPWIRNTGWVKNQDLDPGSGSGMNNLDHISECLKTIFFG